MNQAASASGDGKTDKTPFKTIMEAVRAAGPETTGILIALGEYDEPVDIKTPLILWGACAGGAGKTATTIRLPPGSRPVVHFSTPASATADSPASVGIHLIEIAGGSTGVAAEGPLELTLASVWIHDAEGPGVALADGATATGEVLVEGAMGAGISLDGATLDEGVGENGAPLGPLTVRGTRPFASNGQGGYGIALHPSRELKDISPTTPGRFVASGSTITLDSAVLEDNAGAGLFIEGSAATVTRSVIRNTRANGFGEGRGIVVQSRPLGPVQASLVLQQSVIEQSSDVGVLVIDSPAFQDGTPGVTALIENTTIRDVSGVAGAPEGTPCLGNGLRVRADGVPTGDIAPIVLKNSLIEGAHEAGVHVQGGRVDVSGSIIRGTARCGSDFGDGIDVLGDSRVFATVNVIGSRLEANARAGVASFGAELRVASSVIDGSGATPIASFERGAVPAKVSVRGSACTVGSAAVACDVQAASFKPSLIGGNGCAAFAETGVCFSACYEDALRRLNGQQDPATAIQPVPRVVAWEPEALQLAAAIGDMDGCVEWGGLPPSAPKQVLAVGADGYMPTTLWWTTGANDSIRVHSVFMDQGTLSAVSALLGNLTFDPRVAPWASIETCKPAEPAFRTQPSEPCVGRGVAGLQLQSDGAVGPYYIVGGLVQDRGPGQSMSSDSMGAFANTPPGDFLVRILPPAGGASVSCTADEFDTGWTIGDMPTPDTVRLPTRPGFDAYAMAFCK